MEIKKSTITVDENDILKMAEKIQQNLKEDEMFSKALDEFLNGKLPKNLVLTVGSTPNILHIIGAKSDVLIVNQNVIENCLNDESTIKHGHTSGHNIRLDTLKQLPENIRNPVLICKGSRENSIIAITELKNKDEKNIFVPIAIDVNGAEGTINKILSAYGKDNLDNFLRKSFENGSVIAYNKEKASELFSITRANSPQTSAITCFDNSIAYSDKNVNIFTQEKHTKNKKTNECVADMFEKYGGRDFDSFDSVYDCVVTCVEPCSDENNSKDYSDIFAWYTYKNTNVISDSESNDKYHTLKIECDWSEFVMRHYDALDKIANVTWFNKPTGIDEFIPSWIEEIHLLNAGYGNESTYKYMMDTIKEHPPSTENRIYKDFIENVRTNADEPLDLTQEGELLHR